MKKALYMALSLLLVATLVAGCGAPAASTASSGSTPAAQPGSSAAAAPSSTATGKTVVQFWHCMSGTNGDLTNQLVADYNASQDKIEVVATFQGGYAEAAAKAEQAIFSGNPPDLLQVAQDNVGRLALSGQFADLLPFMQAAGINDKDFVEAFVQDAYYDGKLVAVPYGRSAQIMHINKTALDKAGAKIPTTWEELKETALKCTIKDASGKTTQYGLSIPFDQWELFALIQQAGGSFFNSDVTGLGCIEDGTAEKAFQFLRDLKEAGALYYQDPANDQDTQMFTEGVAAITINSSGAIGGRTKAVGDKFTYVVAPLVKDKIASMPTGGNGFGILAASKNQDAAWDFMQWFIQNEKGGLAFVLGSGYLPFTSQMAQSAAIQQQWKDLPNFKIAYDALKDGDDSYRISNLTPVIAEFRTCIQAIMLDNQDIKASLDTFSKSVEIILAE